MTYAWLKQELVRLQNRTLVQPPFRQRTTSPLVQAPLVQTPLQHSTIHQSHLRQRQPRDDPVSAAPSDRPFSLNIPAICIASIMLASVTFSPLSILADAALKAARGEGAPKPLSKEPEICDRNRDLHFLGALESHLLPSRFCTCTRNHQEAAAPWGLRQ